MLLKLLAYLEEVPSWLGAVSLRAGAASNLLIGTEAEHMSDDAPDLAFCLDLRTLRAWIQHEDGQPVLHLSDGEQHVTVESVAGGSADDAIAGVKRLVAEVDIFAGFVQRSGPIDWWTPPEVVSREPSA